MAQGTTQVGFWRSCLGVLKKMWFAEGDAFDHLFLPLLDQYTWESETEGSYFFCSLPSPNLAR